jgi:PAS domain S-box-containing protein
MPMSENPSEAKFQALLEAAPDAIVIVNAAAEIVLVNAQAEKLFGYAREELLGQSLELLLPERHRHQHAGLMARYFANPELRPMGRSAELYARRRDGSDFRAEISLSPIHTEEGLLVSSAIRDITERKRIEETTLRALQEKDVLLREIHHRVKNNLAAISSLFYLESTYAQDSHQAEVFLESRNRVHSMAMVHEALYESDNLAAVNFAQYLRALAERLSAVYSTSRESLALTLTLEPTFMTIDQAVPCGLIVNELMTNAFKHAFRPTDRGRLDVSLSTQEGYCEVCIHDDGIGVPEDLDLARTGSLGLRLVRSLAGQLDAEITIRPARPGTEARLRFRLTSAHDE